MTNTRHHVQIGKNTNSGLLDCVDTQEAIRVPFIRTFAPDRGKPGKTISDRHCSMSNASYLLYPHNDALTHWPALTGIASITSPFTVVMGSESGMMSSLIATRCRLNTIGWTRRVSCSRSQVLAHTLKHTRLVGTHTLMAFNTVVMESRSSMVKRSPPRAFNAAFAALISSRILV